MILKLILHKYIICHIQLYKMKYIPDWNLLPPNFNQSLPGSFPFKHLPDDSGEIFLHDPKKRQWTVRYLTSKRPALSGGWGKFAVGNNIEVDDVCIFELIAKCHLKVHIFRVLEDIKPLLSIRQARKLGVNPAY